MAETVVANKAMVEKIIAAVFGGEVITTTAKVQNPPLLSTEYVHLKANECVCEGSTLQKTTFISAET
jgi:hypothetical protein